MIKLLTIGLGGAAGAVLRYWVSGWTYRFLRDGFPWGTLGVNLIGSLSIGLIWGVSENLPLSQNAKAFILIGLLGSFTTFSTFSLETFHLIRDGEYWWALYNSALSVILGIGLVFTGFLASRTLMDTIR